MRIEASRVENIDGEFDSVEQFRRLHPGFTIDAIDDREVVGFCEVCTGPIFEGEEYGSSDDGYVCDSHIGSMDASDDDEDPA